MYKTINIDEALWLADACFFDMRSPLEYAEGSIPGAVNVPIFDNAERAEIGTIYRQQDIETAKTRGLEIASAKLPSLVQRIKAIAGRRKIIVYCWRGGMRSRSIATILKLMGVSVYQLAGGYKAYRQYVLRRLQDYKIAPCFVVFHGLTGVGKTALLQELEMVGWPVLDLEGLANHRGSAFGHIGKGNGVTAKNFDALLLAVLDKYQEERFVFVEAESKRIGNVYVPDCVMEAMRRGKHILLIASIKTRVERLLHEYMNESTQEEYTNADIFRCLETLQKRLGKTKTEKLRELLQERKYEAFVEMLLVDYYDPLYDYSEKDVHKFDFHVSTENIREAANIIVKFLSGGMPISHKDRSIDSRFLDNVF